MKDIVWFIKPKDDLLDDLLLRMNETAASLLGETEYTFQPPADGGSSRISIDFKKNFFLAFKETLTNIAKHACATEVRIEVSRRDSMLEMIVRDNGRGFNEHISRRGNGLGSLRNRASTLHGEFEITSLPGKGTTVRFSGKL